MFQLNTSFPSTSQGTTSPCYENKQKLTEIIVADLVSYQDDAVRHSLVVTGSDFFPLDIIKYGQTMRNKVLGTTHEETDIIIVQQV